MLCEWIILRKQMLFHNTVILFWLINSEWNPNVKIHVVLHVPFVRNSCARYISEVFHYNSDGIKHV